MQVGIGYSELPDSTAAGIQAAESAIERSGRLEPCDMVLLFCTSRHHQQVLRDAVASVIGESIPIYGGGAVGIITNEIFGYAGDQVGVACFWMDGSGYHVSTESGMLESEEESGVRLGKKLGRLGTTPDSPVMLFYDAVDRSKGDVRLLMATWLLKGIEKGLGFLPDLTGAGIQGDHVCTPTGQFTGDGISNENVMALTFSDDICIDSAIMHGCRPASAYFTVTKAEGPIILEINGKRAIDFVDELLDSAITPEEYPFFLLFGINHGNKWEEYDEDKYASRLCLDIDKERGGIVMFEPDMVAGTEFQLMFRSLDLDYMKPKIEAIFDHLGDREPVLAVYIDCAGRCAGYGGAEMEDALVLQKTVNGRVPLLGLYTGVEIGSIAGRPRGLDWTGVFCLISRKKQDSPKTHLVGPKKIQWEKEVKELEETKEVPIEAVMKLSEQNAAKVLSLDAQTITLRHELEQKRRGFSLLSELSITLRQSSEYEKIFVATAKRINAALNMQKTAVLLPSDNGEFVPFVLQGYTTEEQQRLMGRYIDVPDQMRDVDHPVLVTAADKDERLVLQRVMLGLPYFISIPVVVAGSVSAILITGRMAEQMPFLSRLGKGDVETVQAIGSLMATILMNKKLHDAEERAKVMLDATPLSANLWDEEYQVIDCNLEAMHLFELPDRQEYLNRFKELSPEYQPGGRKSVDCITENVRKAFIEGRHVFEWTHRKLDGELIPTEVTLERVKYKDKNVVVGFTSDLRELKTRMAEIERTQEELREARDRAEESSRAKSSFLANMSHEIRTPMNAIIGMTEIAKGSDEPERVKYCLGKIEDASGHLLGIINDILDMSKIDAGKFTLSETDFSVESMLQRVSNVINFKVDEKQQRFIIKVDKDVPSSIVADRQRMTQVITNLLSNAVKFTPEGGKISLLLHKEEEDGEECTLRIEVVDTGIGIEKEQQERLFGSFEQADSSISRRFGGTGLGLTISKDIVEMMGGQLTVDSKPGCGSTFRFTAKVKRGKAKRLGNLDSNVNWKNVRILVVDDSPEVLDYFQDIASSIGIFCRTANDAFEASRIMDEEKGFHLIFVDWKMPGMDGIEFTRRIKEKYKDQVVVVMISAVSWTQIEEEARVAGVDRFIPKPLLPSPIVDCIDESISLGTFKETEEVQENKSDGLFDGKCLLLAEDVEINREILYALLEDTGLSIDWAENGEIACEMFEKDPSRYDAVLMDIHMPEMDGYEATKTIRSMNIEEAKQVPIIAMTANVFREDVENCLAAGMNDHLGKPVDIDDLMKKLRKYLL